MVGRHDLWFATPVLQDGLMNVREGGVVRAVKPRITEWTTEEVIYRRRMDSNADVYGHDTDTDDTVEMSVSESVARARVILGDENEPWEMRK